VTLARLAPTLETERVRLRGWRREDFEPYYAILCEPAVYAHFGPEPMGAEECWRRICAAAGNWTLNGFGGWAVESRSDGRLIGNVGLFTAHRQFKPAFGDTPEFGYIFATATHGLGLASEACHAAIDWAEATLDPTPLWAIIAPANAPSLRLAAKLGFSEVTRTDYHGPTIVLQRASW
jgi:RimJ/RimL family protein N-acetyltransferase